MNSIAASLSLVAARQSNEFSLLPQHSLQHLRDFEDGAILLALRGGVAGLADDLARRGFLLAEGGGAVV